MRMNRNRKKRESGNLLKKAKKTHKKRKKAAKTVFPKSNFHG